MEKEIKVYIPINWLTGDTELFGIKDPVLHRMGNMILTKQRRELMGQLGARGIKVIHKKDEIDENTICLVADTTLVHEDERDSVTYKKKFDAIMFANGGENLHFPRTMKPTEYFTNPFFPAVFKNEARNGGVDKFLIENPIQVKKLEMFYQRSLFDPRFNLEWRHVIIQQKIDTPTEYDTYMRVLVAGSGEVLGSSLKCSRHMPGSCKLDGLFERALIRPDSPYCIGFKKMFNYYSGGESISLEKPGKIDEEKRAILESHGLDPNNLHVPEEILDVTKNLMHRCNKELGVMCGFDFILNRSDGRWYYLENQAYPAINEWAAARGIEVPEHTDYASYLAILTVELRARFEALMRTYEHKLQEVKEKGTSI